MKDSIEFVVEVPQSSVPSADRREARAVAEMASTSGWSVVRREIEQRIATLKEQALKHASSVTVKDVKRGWCGLRVTVVAAVSDRERHGAAELERLLGYVDAMVASVRGGEDETV